MEVAYQNNQQILIEFFNDYIHIPCLKTDTNVDQ